jgi:penicillin-binding protein 1B
MGRVTLRYALAHSLNVAAVKVGEMAGFDKVVAIAHQAGLNEDIQPTPAVALGAYQVSPLEIAGAYTMFANNGVRVQPAFISSIRDQSGTELYDHQPEMRRVLDPRVAFVMVDMLQEVMRSGTAAGVRARGFKLPAAGKTGTSHDGWFAGFTSQLLCVVWVGFDDYSELGLEGAHSALPIWTEFMMGAAHYKQYGDAKPFPPPPGVVRVAFDPDTGDLAGPFCPEGVPSYFVDGTQPTSECAPQEIELAPTADGGFAQRVMPMAQRVADR